MDYIQAQAVSVELKGRLAVMLQPGLGQAFPPLKDQFFQVYRKVASLPWVPLTWLAEIQTLQDENPGDAVKLWPSKMVNGSTIPGLPAWLTADQSRIEAWQVLVDTMNKVQGEYARGMNQTLDPNSELNRLMADAAFWNGWAGSALIGINQAARALTEAPGNVVGWMGDGLLSFAGKFLGRTWYLFAIAGVVYVLWANRGKVASKAAAKAGSLL